MKREINSLDQVFLADHFRTQGHELIDILAEYLENSKHARGAVINFSAPEDEYKYWQEYESSDAIQIFKDVISRSINVHHRKYIGHQVSAPAPLAALAGLVSELLNNGMGIYEMGAAPTAIEKVIIGRLCATVGYDKEFSDGFLTSGGTLANLTALLAARARFREVYNLDHGVIVVSDQAHFCIERAAVTMGLSLSEVIKVPCNDNFQIDINLLHQTIEKLRIEQRPIMALIGCACSTSTGSYDDLEELAKVSSENNIWLHVDGAHGAAACFSNKYKYLCAGIQYADSIVLDAHKMLLTPALATALLFKNKEYSYKAMATEAEYLFEKKDDEWYNLTKRTYETTKYMMSLKYFTITTLYGEEVFDRFVTRQYDLARSFADYLEKQGDFELAIQPMSNIVCFRYKQDHNDLNELNKQIRRAILEKGQYYIVQTSLNNSVYLRISIMNPFTDLNDLRELIVHIRGLLLS